MFKNFFQKCLPFLFSYSSSPKSELADSYQIELKNNHVYLIPKETHESTVIWVIDFSKFKNINIQQMHGLGDVPQSFTDLFLSSEVFPISSRIVLLQAPHRPVTINYNAITTSWFDIKQVDFSIEHIDKRVSLTDVEESRQTISKIIDEEASLIGAQNVFLGGFSQGASMAFHTGLSYPQSLGGVIGFSGFYFPHTKIHANNDNTPLFIGHGTADYMIPWKFAQMSYQLLKKFPVTSAIEPDLEHSLSNEQLEKLNEWFITISKVNKKEKVEEEQELKQNKKEDI